MIHLVTCSWASISMGKTHTDVMCDLLHYVSGVTNLFPLQPSITVPLSSHYLITSSFMLIRSRSQIKVFIPELADIITTLDWLQEYIQQVILRAWPLQCWCQGFIWNSKGNSTWGPSASYSMYSGTPPYDHPVNTTTLLLWPLYSGLKKAQSVIFLLKEPL